jgi:hypothetical protein
MRLVIQPDRIEAGSARASKNMPTSNVAFDQPTAPGDNESRGESRSKPPGSPGANSLNRLRRLQRTLTSVAAYRIRVVLDLDESDVPVGRYVFER